MLYRNALIPAVMPPHVPCVKGRHVPRVHVVPAIVSSSCQELPADLHLRSVTSWSTAQETPQTAPGMCTSRMARLANRGIITASLAPVSPLTTNANSSLVNLCDRVTG